MEEWWLSSLGFPKVGIVKKELLMHSLDTRLHRKCRKRCKKGIIDLLMDGISR
ncbi:hypothetical protein DITRI_Ditri01bG0013200 [Diplodiscus trichospermus]